MLNAKNGVITEDRFQKLSVVQWLFHYLEVVSFKKKEREQQSKDIVEILTSVLDAYDNRLNILLKAIANAGEVSGMISNPKAAQEILNKRELEKARLDIKPDEFEDTWNDLRKYIPESFSIAGFDDDLEGEDKPSIDLEKLNEYIADEIEKTMESKR